MRATATPERATLTLIIFAIFSFRTSHAALIDYFRHIRCRYDMPLC